MKIKPRIQSIIFLLIAIIGFIVFYRTLPSNINDTITVVEGVEFQPSTNTYFVNSPGGHSSIFSEIATEMVNTNSVLSVKEKCMSACAEYLLHSSTSLRLLDHPIIGLHGNPIVMEMIKTEFYPDETKNCLTTSADKLRELQKRNGVSSKYNEEQIKKLKVKSVQLGEKIQGCQTKKVTFENYMWLPKSDQLVELLNLSFEGGTCADQISKCKRRASRRWSEGTKLVIGEEEYVTVGWYKSWFE